MHGNYRALAWGGVDVYLLGRTARRVFGCESCVEKNGNSFAVADLLGIDLFVRGDLLGVFPCGDVCRQLESGFLDVRDSFRFPCMAFGCVETDGLPCVAGSDNLVGMGAKPAAVSGEAVPSVEGLGVRGDCAGFDGVDTFDAVQRVPVFSVLREEKDMSYRRWFRGTVLCIFAAMFLLAGVVWLVDPIEIWEAPIIRGFNHIKPKQAVFLDVFKPFQVQRHKPDIVYIGTSRVYVGFRPEENAYNMGGSSLSLPDIRSYLRFIYSQHVPKKVFIGLDLFQFSRDSMTKPRDGFSEERLGILNKGRLASVGEAIETSYGMSKYLKETVRSSFENRNKKKEWERGWDVKRGVRADVDIKTYYHVLHSYHGSYTKFVYDPNALPCLHEILDEAEAHGIEVILFFNPVSVDLLALQSICGRAEDFQRIKRDLAVLHPVFDFAWASSLSIDREGVWLDGSHYHYPIGERMKASMTGEVDTGICRELTAETVEMHLREEAALYDRWTAEHSNYVKALARSAPERIPVGSLKQYLGF